MGLFGSKSATTTTTVTNSPTTSQSVQTVQTTVINPPDVPGVLITQSLDDIFPKNATQTLGVGVHNISTLEAQIKQATGSSRYTTLLIKPNTAVKITYNNNTSRIINNTYSMGEGIVLDTNGIIEINVKSINATIPPSTTSSVTATKLPNTNTSTTTTGIEKFVTQYGDDYNNDYDYKSILYYIFIIALIAFIYYFLVKNHKSMN